MPKRKNKNQILSEMIDGPRKAAVRQPRVNRENQVISRKSPRVPVAAKRNTLPRALKPSVIRKICRLPPEKNLENTEAKVMYVNSRFSFLNGECSQTACHEAACPKKRSAPKQKPRQRTRAPKKT
ncbi:uncharacterized protein LOC108051189 [Drosophila rhopaloa]|uniref:Uncharacterized protein LOC108051189 n=1 Tax=Drosophila rhopaloa TaxID=1041015 RepID=A0A6P4FMI7_DRORH|nr:uncharacterized protein LOC108051189 [Drosophila rhopaloa]